MRFPLKLNKWDESKAWYDGSLWLSLDRFERFWPDVGLAFSNGDVVKEAARAALRGRYAIDAESEEEEEDDLNGPDRLTPLGEAFFEAVGPESGTRIAAWLMGPVYAAANEPVWHQTWPRIFYHMPELDPAPIASEYGIDLETMKKVIEIAARYKRAEEEIEARVEAADKEPLTGWDFIAYEEYQRGSWLLSPLDGLGRHLQCLRFDKAWMEVLRLARRDEVDGLVRWGRAYVASNMPSSAPYVDVPEHARSPSWAGNDPSIRR